MNRERTFRIASSPGVLFSRMDNAHPGSCGKLILNSEAKIVDVSTGESLGPNQPGELVVRYGKYVCNNTISGAH